MLKVGKILFILVPLVIYIAQPKDLSSHKWKDRLLLVMTDDLSNPFFLDQLAELNTDIPGLDDRKLKIYQVTPTEYMQGLSDGIWNESGKLFEGFKESDSPFEIVLIGLDGGVKLLKTIVLTLTEIFGTIDAMPMRVNELKRKL